MSIYYEKAQAIMTEVKKAVSGKDDCIRKIMTGILSDGHILIEDVPGVGKTTMALAFSKAMNLNWNRIQFTPDVMPSDITGFSMYQKDTGTFVYQPGAAMCNLILADEINRTSPKTQSALLEVMEEGQVTVDGVTREVPKPFIVIATENPVGSAGTQKLPSAQLDRFTISLSVGYPDLASEIHMLKERKQSNPLDLIEPIISAEELLLMQQEVQDVFIHDALYDYLAHLITATRNNPLLELGVSPRGTLALARVAQANAFLSGRDYVQPDDIADAFLDVAAHRVHRNAKARVAHVTKAVILENILQSVTKPVPKKRDNR